MATYRYACHNCEVMIDDVVHSIHEDPLIECPECNKPMERVPVTCNFEIKGYSHRKRRMTVDKRIKDREQREDWKSLSEDQKWEMKRIASKYSKHSAYLNDPAGDKKKRQKKDPEKFLRDQEKQLKKLKGVKEAEFT
jgi:putative FmdB family regulatory protein